MNIAKVIFGMMVGVSVFVHAMDDIPHRSYTYNDNSSLRSRNLDDVPHQSSTYDDNRIRPNPQLEGTPSCSRTYNDGDRLLWARDEAVSCESNNNNVGEIPHETPAFNNKADAELLFVHTTFGQDLIVGGDEIDKIIKKQWKILLKEQRETLSKEQRQTLTEKEKRIAAQLLCRRVHQKIKKTVKAAFATREGVDNRNATLDVWYKGFGERIVALTASAFRLKDRAKKRSDLAGLFDLFVNKESIKTDELKEMFRFLMCLNGGGAVRAELPNLLSAKIRALVFLELTKRGVTLAELDSPNASSYLDEKELRGPVLNPTMILSFTTKIDVKGAQNRTVAFDEKNEQIVLMLDGKVVRFNNHGAPVRSQWRQLFNNDCTVRSQPDGSVCFVGTTGIYDANGVLRHSYCVTEKLGADRVDHRVLHYKGEHIALCVQRSGDRLGRILFPAVYNLRTHKIYQPAEKTEHFCYRGSDITNFDCHQSGEWAVMREAGYCMAWDLLSGKCFWHNLSCKYCCLVPRSDLVLMLQEGNQFSCFHKRDLLKQYDINKHAKPAPVMVYKDISTFYPNLITISPRGDCFAFVNNHGEIQFQYVHSAMAPSKLPIIRFAHRMYPVSIAFNSDGTRLVVVTEDGVVSVYKVYSPGNISAREYYNFLPHK